MPEKLSIDAEQAQNNDACPVSIALRRLPRLESSKSESGNGSIIPNGLHRSNLTSGSTDSILRSAQENATSHMETVLAKYVVGCDGAHCWTRRQIGSVMIGEQTDYGGIGLEFYPFIVPQVLWNAF